ncbi:hypothetical protein CA13_33530 [Planctomycetes bacterium CA13]|uniref:DUF58 domain-containing protein n=1 Tax=Novipirellula herctigrandis TaxID=2527986 RepID=A0A5C5Z3I1_9BACT|nr:hypothetical protein CA13_33530 [Planctomycetes bacterium CA13]
MSAELGTTTIASNEKPNRGWFYFGKLLRFLLAVIVSPIRTALAIRRSATAASVSLLLIGIVTLNILWGYPWIGLFAGCVSAMAIGLVVNRFLMPKLAIGFSLPRSVEAGQAVPLRMHLKNRRPLPALQLLVGFDSRETRSLFRKRTLFSRKHSRSQSKYRTYEVKSDEVAVSLIGPRERVSIEASIAYSYRGIQKLPRVRVKSLFPFCLYESTTVFPSSTTIAVTPRLLAEGDDAVAGGQLSDLSNWARQFKTAEACDYFGSREYETGMPVRRWDFASWARLGKPIVREFRSPGVRTAVMLVDTAPETDVKNKHAIAQDRDEGVERVLSLAATAITELRQRGIGVQMIITGEDPERLQEQSRSSSHSSDLETLLIRLAQAKNTSISDADKACDEVVQMMPGTPFLVLTSRSHFSAELHSAASKILRVDNAHERGPHERGRHERGRHERGRHERGPHKVGPRQQGLLLGSPLHESTDELKGERC